MPTSNTSPTERDTITNKMPNKKVKGVTVDLNIFHNPDRIEIIFPVENEMSVDRNAISITGKIIYGVSEI